MVYQPIPIETLLSTYEPPDMQIRCARCKRDAVVSVQTLRKRFGVNVTIGDVVQRKVPVGDGWIFEMKYDGYRALAAIAAD